MNSKRLSLIGLTAMALGCSKKQEAPEGLNKIIQTTAELPDDITPYEGYTEYFREYPVIFRGDQATAYVTIIDDTRYDHESSKSLRPVKGIVGFDENDALLISMFTFKTIASVYDKGFNGADERNQQEVYTDMVNAVLYSLEYQSQ